MEANNILLAEFLGFQLTALGWYDAVYKACVEFVKWYNNESI